MDLTTVIACKDRERNIDLCVKSIFLCEPRPRLTIVDFGSQQPLRKRLEAIFPGINVIRVERNTKIFHKTRALNIGIKDVSSKYICLTDADQIFQKNFFGEICRALEQRGVFITCNTFFLQYLDPQITAKTFDINTYNDLLSFARHNKRSPFGEGCCHATTRDWLHSVGGHDERYIGWGFEDKDLLLRAMHIGLTEIRISNKTSMIHMPHNRDINYFNKEFRLRNERMFEDKKNSCIVKANLGINWGAL